MSRRLGIPLSLVVLAGALLTGGCWDYRDINDRSLVLGVAIDAAPDHGHAVTAELASPALANQPGPGAGGGKGGAVGGGAPPAGRALIRATAATSSHALAWHRRTWSRPLEFGLQGLWILGEDYARRGEKDEFGCQACHPAMSTAMHFLVADGHGGDYLAAPPPEGTFVSSYLSNLVRSAAERGSIPPVDHISEFVAAMEESGVALAPRLSWDSGRPKLAGAGVFRNYRLIGWLDEDATEGVNFLLGTARRTTVVVPCPPLPVGGAVTGARMDTTVEILGRSSKLRVESRDGRPTLRYRLKASALAMDSGCPRAPGPRGVSSDEERLLARETARAVHARALRAIGRQRELGADFLGWGAYLRRFHPGLWRELGANWDAALRNLPVDVEVSIRIFRHSRFH